MKLITAHAWVEKYFAPESKPAEITLMRWLRCGKVHGRKVGGTWYGYIQPTNWTWPPNKLDSGGK